MAHVVFPVFLYLLGLLLLLPARATLSTRFVAWTAFAWGALAWMVSALLVLILPVPYTPAALLVTLTFLSLVAVLLARRASRQPAPLSLADLWLPFALFVLVVTIPTVLQIAEVHPDTFDMLLMAEDLADGMLAPETLFKFGLFGMALPLLHSPAPWLGVAFFYSLPAAFAFTILAAFRFFCMDGLQRLGLQRPHAARSANLITLLLASTMWIVFQFAYFHNGSVAATYMLLGVAAAWFALLGREQLWLWLATLAFLGLSITRVETVFFALGFLAVALAMNRFSPDEWLPPLAPFTVLLVGWYAWLLLVIRPDTKFLTPPRILVFMAITVAFFLGVAGLRLAAIRRFFAPHLYRLLFVVLGLVVVVLAVVYPQRLGTALWSTAVNLFLLGITWWGLIWWLIAGAFLLLTRTPRFEYDRLFLGAIGVFFALYLSFGVLHGTVIAFDGSDNRMALHILPVMLLYLTLRAAPFLGPLPAGSEPVTA